MNFRIMKTSLKSLQDKFGAAPYGFDSKDVQWLVAMLFELGRVSLTLNSQSLTFAPTIREICKMVGVASTSSVYAHLKILEEKGYIARKMDASRAIAIL